MTHYFAVTGKRWFQRTNGNTYHSVLVERVFGVGESYKREVLAYVPFQYGYGDHYLQTAAEILGMEYGEMLESMRKQPELWVVNVYDVSRKKDL